MTDPLEALLRPVANLLNRNIAEMTPARELAAQLDRRTIAICVRDTALAMYFVIDDGLIQLAADVETDPDVAITGSLLTLAGILRAGGEQAIRDGAVELTGDAQTAMLFQELLGYAKPDLEEELSAFIGDAAAHQVGELARSVGTWTREARRTMRANIREYLQEESRSLPSRYEVDRFTAQLDELRDDVDRLEARLARLDRDT